LLDQFSRSQRAIGLVILCGVFVFQFHHVDC
jgi:hypothetical protein